MGEQHEGADRGDQTLPNGGAGLERDSKVEFSRSGFVGMRFYVSRFCAAEIWKFEICVSSPSP